MQYRTFSIQRKLVPLKVRSSRIFETFVLSNTRPGLNLGFCPPFPSANKVPSKSLQQTSPGVPESQIQSPITIGDLYTGLLFHVYILFSTGYDEANILRKACLIPGMPFNVRYIFIYGLYKGMFLSTYYSVPLTILSSYFMALE